MKTYLAESALKDRINKNTAISFLMKPEKASEEEIKLMSPDISQLVKAHITDNDLYYHKSILVTTNWNFNDDVFLPEVVWKARTSPIHKPTNLNHESSKIVGHMTGSWAIDAEGSLISEDIEISDLPKKFHILTGSVIYKKFHNDSDYQETVEALIREIEEGKQYVSMECTLRNFSYVIKSETDPKDIKIIERNQDTAFLTKHLRAYGGDGFYENYKIGRALKDISFIGKAYTPKPANKESIIFTSKDVFDFANASFFEKIPSIKKNSVLSDSKIDYNGEKSMSDLLQEQNSELKSKNDSLASQVEDLKNQLAKADVQKFEARVLELEAAVEAEKSAYKKQEEDVKTKDKMIQDQKAKNEALSSELETLKAELVKAATEKTFAERVSFLVDSDIDKSLAEEKVNTFAFLNDDQFAVIAKEIIAANKKDIDTKEDKTEAELKTKKDKELVEASDVDGSDVVDEDDSAIATETDDKVIDKVEEQQEMIAALGKKLYKNLSRGDK